MSIVAYAAEQQAPGRARAVLAVVELVEAECHKDPKAAMAVYAKNPDCSLDEFYLHMQRFRVLRAKRRRRKRRQRR